MCQRKTPPLSIAERIDALIRASGLSTDQFAQRAGLDPARLTEALHGQRRFSSLDLAKIGDFTETDVEWLITGRRPRLRTRLSRAGIWLGWRVRRLWWRLTDLRLRN